MRKLYVIVLVTFCISFIVPPNVIAASDITHDLAIASLIGAGVLLIVALTYQYIIGIDKVTDKRIIKKDEKISNESNDFQNYQPEKFSN